MRRLIGMTVLAAALGVGGCHHPANNALIASGVTVNGRVLDVRGMAVNGAEVSLYVADAGSTARPVSTGSSSGSGSFALRSVEPGVYLLRVVKNGFRESNQQLRVGAGTMQTVTVQLF